MVGSREGVLGLLESVSDMHDMVTRSVINYEYVRIYNMGTWSQI